MSITIECATIDCGTSCDIDMEADWSPAQSRDRAYARTDLDYGDAITVYLPEGWRVERVAGAGTVIHCPDHAETEAEAPCT